MTSPPKNGWLEYDPSPIRAKGLFSGAFAVSFREDFYIQLVVFGRDSTVVNDDVASKISRLHRARARKFGMASESAILGQLQGPLNTIGSQALNRHRRAAALGNLCLG